MTDEGTPTTGRGHRSRDRAAFAALAVFLVLSLALGGASRESFISHLFLNGLAAALLFWRLADPGFRQLPVGLYIPLAGYLALVLVAVLQLLPLPQELWTRFAGHAPVREAFNAIGAAPPAMPLSLVPEATFLALLGLLPPIAVLVLAGSLSLRRFELQIAILAAGVAVSTALLALMQILTGSQDAFFRFSYSRSMAGAFANLNHQAHYLILTVPLITVGLDRLMRRRQQGHGVSLAIVPVGIAMALAIFGVVAAGSAAGWTLGALVLFYALSVFSRSLRRWSLLILPVAAIAATGGMLALVISSPLITNGLGFDASTGETRLQTWSQTLSVLPNYLPFGSGLGSFESVYRFFEDKTVPSYVFMNQAHNDYVEFLLEAGLIGGLLAAAALIWLGHRTWSVWRAEEGAGVRLARAATVGLWVIALHSIVDYPLRTPAIACLAALLAALTYAHEQLDAVRTGAPGKSGKAQPVHKQLDL